MATEIIPKQISILDAYPIGAIYISVSSTPPDELFGGIWEVFGTGRTLVGINTNETEFNTSEKTGGEKTHKLTATEMPSHTHASIIVNGMVMIDGSGSGGTASGYGINASWVGPYSNWIHHLRTDSQGGNGAHNNLQPYITVYMWKRTA